MTTPQQLLAYTYPVKIIKQNIKVPNILKIIIELNRNTFINSDNEYIIFMIYIYDISYKYIIYIDRVDEPHIVGSHFPYLLMPPVKWSVASYGQVKPCSIKGRNHDLTSRLKLI